MAYNSLHDEYLVVWYTLQDGYTRDVCARRVGSDRSLESWLSVATGAGEIRCDPVVAYSSEEDRYLIVYTYEFVTDDYDIYASLVHWNGS